jgi:hypothetical protein
MSKEDTTIALANVVATIAKNCPEQAPNSLVGAGLIAGVILARRDGKLMERVIDAVFTPKQLKGTRDSAKAIVRMFATLEEVDRKVASDGH